MSKTPKKAPRKAEAPAKRAGTNHTPAAGFEEVLSLIDSAKARTIAAVNTALIDLYWNIGQHISGKIADAGWGKGTVVDLAETIGRRYPTMRRFSASNLWRMVQFYETYRGQPKLAPLVRELSWTHNLLILSRSKREVRRGAAVAAVEKEECTRLRFGLV